MASRTRERLIDVARQLFVRQGIDNTTMNDIATASDRGRRTLYTYFRTKSDIYQAVIEAEVAKIRRELEESVAAASTPKEKLRALMYRRINIVSENQHGYEMWLRSLFSRDIKRANRIRAMVAERIYEMIGEIVDAGIRSGDFIPEQARRLTDMLTLMMRGIDWTLAHDFDPDTFRERCDHCVDFILDAICTPRADSSTTIQTINSSTEQ